MYRYRLEWIFKFILPVKWNEKLISNFPAQNVCLNFNRTFVFLIMHFTNTYNYAFIFSVRKFIVEVIGRIHFFVLGNNGLHYTIYVDECVYGKYVIWICKAIGIFITYECIACCWYTFHIILYIFLSYRICIVMCNMCAIISAKSLKENIPSSKYML